MHTENDLYNEHEARTEHRPACGGLSHRKQRMTDSSHHACGVCLIYSLPLSTLTLNCSFPCVPNFLTISSCEEKRVRERDSPRERDVKAIGIKLKC